MLMHADKTGNGKVLFLVVIASNLFGCFNEDTARDYIQRLKSGEVNEFCAYKNIRLVGEDAIPVLDGYVKDNNPVVRHLVAWIMGTYHSKKAHTVLHKMINDSDMWVRAMVIESMGGAGDIASIPWIESQLQSTVEEIRLKSIFALACLSSTISFDAISNLSKDKSSAVRREVAMAFEILGSRKATPVLIELLKDEDSSVRMFSVKALGRIGDVNAYDEIVKMLADSEPDVQQQTIYALEDLGAPPPVDKFIFMLRDSSSRVRTTAMSALGRLKARKAIPALLTFLKGWNEDKVCAVAALKEITGLDFGEDYSKWSSWYSTTQLGK
jgi:HEAT repeat protein